MKPDSFSRVARLGELTGDGPFSVSANGRDVVLVRTPAGWRAFEGRCPHQGALLGEGEIERGRARLPQPSVAVFARHGRASRRAGVPRLLSDGRARRSRLHRPVRLEGVGRRDAKNGETPAELGARSEGPARPRQRPSGRSGPSSPGAGGLEPQIRPDVPVPRGVADRLCHDRPRHDRGGLAFKARNVSPQQA